MSNERIRGNGHKLTHGKFYLNIKENFFTVQVVSHWNKLPRDVEEPLSLELLKTLLDQSALPVAALSRNVVLDNSQGSLCTSAIL